MRKLGNKYEDINNFDDAVDSVKHMSTVQRKVTKWIIVILVSVVLCQDLVQVKMRFSSS